MVSGFRLATPASSKTQCLREWLTRACAVTFCNELRARISELVALFDRLDAHVHAFVQRVCAVANEVDRARERRANRTLIARASAERNGRR
jgi:hypothetical protein